MLHGLPEHEIIELSMEAIFIDRWSPNSTVVVAIDGVTGAVLSPTSWGPHNVSLCGQLQVCGQIAAQFAKPSPNHSLGFSSRAFAGAA